MIKAKLYTLLFTAVFLSACGGGQSEAEVKTPTTPLPTPVQEITEVSENKLGAWLWYIDEQGLVKGDHKSMANYLAEMGVKRVFIKIRLR